MVSPTNTDTHPSRILQITKMIAGVVSIHLPVLLLAQYTADVTLTDSTWTDIGQEYPSATSVIYVEVYDPDVSGSIEVTFTTDTEPGGELVILSEVSAGLFRGSIPVDFQALVTIAPQEATIRTAQRLSELQAEYPAEPEGVLRTRARMEVYREAAENHLEGSKPALVMGVAAADSLLQVSTGDVITVSYVDSLNDYGNQETVTDQAVYGGWAGYVSGTWTAANSPYVITGDLYVDNNQSLTIEPGVEVRFFGEYGFYLYGDLTAVGTVTDSIFFTYHQALSDSIVAGDTSYYAASYWQGLQFYDWQGSSSRLAYCRIEQAYTGINLGWSEVSLSIENSWIGNCQQFGLYLYGINDSIRVSDCVIEGNGRQWWWGGGIEIGYSNQVNLVTISGSVIRNNNGYGMYLGSNFSGLITGCDITDNTDFGFYISNNADGDNLSINNCNIWGNSGWVDVYVYGNTGAEIDMQSNFWGDSTTAEMNAGGNPKNISRIYDWWDTNDGPVVNYAGWLQAPFLAPQISFSPELMDTIIVEGDSMSFLLTIKNTGEGDLTFSLGTGAANTSSIFSRYGLDGSNTSQGFMKDRSVQGEDIIGTISDNRSDISANSLRRSRTSGEGKITPKVHRDKSEYLVLSQPRHSNASIPKKVIYPSGISSPDPPETDDISWISFSQSSGTITPGDSALVTVMLDASALGAGDYLANIHIYSNDPMRSTVRLPVTLRVITDPVLISVNPVELNFGPVALGTSLTLDIWIRNDGNIQLNVYGLAISNPMFVHSDSSFSISPSDSHSVSVKFMPTASGEYHEKLIVSSNATFYPVLPIDLTSIGILPSIEQPIITSIPDIPNDQGRKVLVKWEASPNDGNIYNPVLFYTIWIEITGLDSSQPNVRKVASFEEIYSFYSRLSKDQIQLSTSMDNSDNGTGRVNEILTFDGVWAGLGSIGATQDTAYSFVASTFIDSNHTGLNWSYFKVSAHSIDALDFATSEVDSGYSVDNIAPGVPADLAATSVETGVQLTWSYDMEAEEDFQYFAVYRSREPSFTVEPGDSSTTITIASPVIDSAVEFGQTYFYKVAAVDYNGNFSEVSNEASATVLGLEELADIPEIYALHQNYPNPFNPSTNIRFDLPRNSDVLLIIYDLRGRQVTFLKEGTMGPGYHREVWNGRTHAGAELPSGIYIARLVTPEYSKSIKMMLLK